MRKSRKCRVYAIHPTAYRGGGFIAHGVLKDLTPSRDILKLYKQLGGEIITIGSDSHKKEHLGAYIEETKLELKNIGFNQYCIYDKMKPIYHQL